MNDGANLDCTHGVWFLFLELDLVLDDAEVATDGDFFEFAVVVITPYEAEGGSGEDDDHWEPHGEMVLSCGL